MRSFPPLLTLLLLSLAGSSACAASPAQEGGADAQNSEQDDAPQLSSSDYGALKLRSIGPAITGLSRLIDISRLSGASAWSVA